jgi:hypothetical protein
VKVTLKRGDPRYSYGTGPEEVLKGLYKGVPRGSFSCLVWSMSERVVVRMGHLVPCLVCVHTSLRQNNSFGISFGRACSRLKNRVSSEKNGIVYRLVRSYCNTPRTSN